MLIGGTRSTLVVHFAGERVGNVVSEGKEAYTAWLALVACKKLTGNGVTPPSCDMIFVIEYLLGRVRKGC